MKYKVHYLRKAQEKNRGAGGKIGRLKEMHDVKSCDAGKNDPSLFL
jgi:hypothetical protein